MRPRHVILIMAFLMHTIGMFAWQDRDTHTAIHFWSVALFLGLLAICTFIEEKK